MAIEKMSNFFTARVDRYDEHMIKNVEGYKEGYIKMAELLPKGVNGLLDLGCGIGLELDEIFKSKPYDTPCTIDNQIELLSKAGFKTVKMNWRMENTTIIIAKK